MKEKKIRLTTIMEAKEFVVAAMKCDFKVDVCCNRLSIDAKSILGILSLDLTRELTVRLHGEDEVFEAFCDNLAPGVVDRIA